MVAYAHQNKICRTQFIQEYFGETTDKNCGICDWCIADKKSSNLESQEKKLEKKILETLTNSGELNESQLLRILNLPASEMIFSIVRSLEDSGKISSNSDGNYIISTNG
jgi:ATP-dependent DNA helicase RecQ